MGASAENFQNQPDTIEHLGVPRLLEITLLHGRESAVHHHDVRFVGFDDAGDLLDLAFAEKRARADIGNRAPRRLARCSDQSPARVQPLLRVLPRANAAPGAHARPLRPASSPRRCGSIDDRASGLTDPLPRLGDRRAYRTGGTPIRLFPPEVLQPLRTAGSDDPA